MLWIFDPQKKERKLENCVSSAVQSIVRPLENRVVRALLERAEATEDEAPERSQPAGAELEVTQAL